MKKVLLSLVALVALTVACGSKYPAEMTTLVEQTTLKFDSVQTMEQFEAVTVQYATEVEALSAKYAADASEEVLAKVTEQQQKMVATVEAAMQRAIAAQAADTVAVDSVAITEVVEVK